MTVADLVILALLVLLAGLLGWHLQWHADEQDWFRRRRRERMFLEANRAIEGVPEGTPTEIWMTCPDHGRSQQEGRVGSVIQACCQQADVRVEAVTDKVEGTKG